MDARVILSRLNFSVASFTPLSNAPLRAPFATIVDQREQTSPVYWNIHLDTPTGSVSLLPVLLVPSTDGKRNRCQDRRRDKLPDTHLLVHQCDEHRQSQWQTLGGQLPTREALDLHPSCLEMRDVSPYCSSYLVPQSD